jgi:hypothetical protein
VATDRITAATRAEVERSLTGRRRDPGETAFSILLLMTLVVALVLLAVPAIDIAAAGIQRILARAIAC